MVKNNFFNFIIRGGIVAAWVFFLLGAVFLATRVSLSSDAHKIVVFAWGDMFHPEVITRFEQESGIKVILSAFGSNEEMLTKLRATGGKGFDLIICSDYAVRLLIDEKLIQKLDKTRMMNVISPFLRILPYDRHQEYAIPMEWEIFGIGYDTMSKWPEKIQKWHDIFDLSAQQKIIMVNDALEAVWIAARALNIEELTSDKHWKRIAQLLQHQKKSVLAYTDNRADYYLITHNAPCAVASSSYIWRTQQEYPHLKFIIPDGPIFITIENIVLSKACTQKSAVYKFIDFLMREDIQNFHAQVFKFLPAHADVLQKVIEKHEHSHLLQDILQGSVPLMFFKPLSAQNVTQTWMAVKSS